MYQHQSNYTCEQATYVQPHVGNQQRCELEHTPKFHRHTDTSVTKSTWELLSRAAKPSVQKPLASLRPHSSREARHGRAAGKSLALFVCLLISEAEVKPVGAAALSLQPLKAETFFSLLRFSPDHFPPGLER